MSPVTHQTIKLGKGKHSSPEEGACVMELASMLASEPFSDHPASVCPVIASFLRAYNDSVDDAGVARELRAVQPHLARSRVHHRDEALLRPRDVLRERDRGVVARGQQQPVEQRLEPDALVKRQEADAGPGVAGRGARDQHGFVRPGL